MKATRAVTSFMLMALLLTGETALARDWRWYPRKAPADAGALQPDLEGTKRGDDEQEGLSELEEMRQWLRQRDEERRQRGITLPDTVEQLEPAGDLRLQGRRWNTREGQDASANHPSGESLPGGQTLDEQSQRVRDTLFPHFSGKRHSKNFGRKRWNRHSIPSKGTRRKHR